MLEHSDYIRNDPSQRMTILHPPRVEYTRNLDIKSIDANVLEAAENPWYLSAIGQNSFAECQWGYV